METKSEYDVYYDDDTQDNIYDKIEEKTNDEETPKKVRDRTHITPSR